MESLPRLFLGGKKSPFFLHRSKASPVDPPCHAGRGGSSSLVPTDWLERKHYRMQKLPSLPGNFNLLANPQGRLVSRGNCNWN